MQYNDVHSSCDLDHTTHMSLVYKAYAARIAARPVRTVLTKLLRCKSEGHVARSSIGRMRGMKKVTSSACTIPMSETITNTGV